MHSTIKKLTRFQRGPMNVQLEEKEKKPSSQETQRVDTRRLGKSGLVADS